MNDDEKIERLFKILDEHSDVIEVLIKHNNILKLNNDTAIGNFKFFEKRLNDLNHRIGQLAAKVDIELTKKGEKYEYRKH